VPLYRPPPPHFSPPFLGPPLFIKGGGGGGVDWERLSLRASVDGIQMSQTL